jgi:hypothetical protein
MVSVSYIAPNPRASASNIWSTFSSIKLVICTRRNNDNWK